MIQTDDELRRWWDRLAIAERFEIVERIEERALSGFVQNIASSVRKKIEVQITPNSVELRQLKKWGG